MSSQTPNLDLTLWDSPTDQFSSADLVDNFQKIDADYTRPRPANQVENLAAVPAIGNFNGRLIYLTAADAGFAAGTVLEYQSTVWKVVGPVEVLAAVPSTGNYAGRMVLLSAANGGFESWTLIRYNGTSWATANRTYELLATVPSSGNFAGRLVMLTNADGGFGAYDLIRFNGSSWALVGPQPIPPGTELGYEIQATDVNTTNTVDPGTTLVTFDAATFQNVKYYLEIDIPNVSTDVANSELWFRMREGGSNIGNAMRVDTYDANKSISVFHRIAFTPTAASHTYTVTWWLGDAGTGTIWTTALSPAIFRIFKS